MTRTFLVAITVDDGTFDPVGDAEAIQDACESAGLLVESVKMWTAPTLQPLPGTPSFPPPTLPA